MTYETLLMKMREHNQQNAPGSESTEWQAFVADIYEETGYAPWNDAILENNVPGYISDYWITRCSL